jgi:SAM-dependent methyltransferase
MKFSLTNKRATAAWRFPRQHRNYFAECLNQIRLRHILELVLSHVDCEDTKTVLDVGCGSGAVSNVLAEVCQTVGIEIQKSYLKVHGKNRNLNFVVADIDGLPFKTGSFDLIVCASVLEHMLNLDSALTKLKSLLKTNGILFAGYPVETCLFKMIWRIVSPVEFKFIDQTQTFFINPDTQQLEDYWKYPMTHKQTYLSIREGLDRHFRLVQRVRLPFKFLPDFTNYYECAELINDPNRDVG